MTGPRCAVYEVKRASMWAHRFWIQLHKAVSYKVFLEILIFCTFERHNKEFLFKTIDSKHTCEKTKSKNTSWRAWVIFLNCSKM